MKFAVIVPTRNAVDAEQWSNWLDSFNKQTICPDISIVIDSESTDNTVILAKKYGIKVVSIKKDDFNHGGTRNYAVHLCVNVDILVFLTQDAILNTPDAFANLLALFNDSQVACVCGRQIPHVNANPLAVHARYYNYPATSIIKSSKDIENLGIKAAFMSNSFSAYRKNIFDELGEFPSSTILAEDMYLAAKMILAGYKVAYCAEAIVRHSHNYTPWEEFHRYFDTGVFHACEPWIQQRLGGASGEGIRFIKSELNYLWHHAPLWIPRALLTTGCKFLGYKLGRHYKTLPKSWRSKFSMYRSYWLQ
jgi:rhamnosyltransferase